MQLLTVRPGDLIKIVHRRPNAALALRVGQDALDFGRGGNT